MAEKTENRRTFLKVGGATIAGLTGSTEAAAETQRAPQSGPKGTRTAGADGASELAKVLAVPEAFFRPTATGCTVQWIADQELEAQVLAGRDVARLSPVHEGTATGPTAVALQGFRPDSPIYLQCRFRKKGTQQWISGPVRWLHTARSPGRIFRIALIADSHIYYAVRFRRHVENLRKTMSAVLRDEPDFVIFLGDEAGVRYRNDAAGAMNQQLAVDRWRLWRTAFAPLLAAVPSYMVLGNHEGEAGYYQSYDLRGHRKHYQRWGTVARKRHCLNPLPDTYPEGGENDGWQGQANSPATGGAADGNRSPLQNYYAWTWGDALFVVLDVHRYTNVGGGFPGTVDQWSLGRTQLEWFKRTLTASKARWKFVVAHHLVGGAAWDLLGKTRETNYVYGRGGARYARTGQQAQITEVMRQAGARFFLYGHDHVFAHQQAEGIHFVCCGRPTYLHSQWWDKPGWKEAYGDVAARNPHDFYGAIGYTRLTVSADQVTLDYVRTGTDARRAENVSQPEGATVYSFRAIHQA